MFRPIGSELADMRAVSLRADGGRRRETSPGPLRRALGLRFVAAGERLTRSRTTPCLADVEICENR